MDRLRLQIDDVKANNLGKELIVESDDEIGRLTESFNDLSKRLSRSFEAQKQFVQDASHEIKTPLTIIQTNLDIALDNENASKEELREAMEGALKGYKTTERPHKRPIGAF